MGNQGRGKPMPGIFRRPVVWILLAVTSYCIAILAALGLILADDVTGRLIYGILWFIIGSSWLGRYFVESKTQNS